MDDTNTRQTILIVDDVPINIQVLARALSSDWHVKIATGGKKALEIATTETSLDLILLDIMMPDIDGFEVIKHLKDNAKTRNIPVIFITAKGEIDDETKGLELGAVDYITKPFHLPIVKARVKTHLNLKKKNDMLEQLASLDPLTNIANRRRFDEVLKAEWNRSRRSGSPLSLLMVDIDNFKFFNDNYGHAAGDDCLITIAQALNSSLKRSGDFCARFGGEEFVIVLPQTDVKGGQAIAEKLRAYVESLNIPHSFSEVADHITVSVGIATTIPNAENTPESLLNNADEMLYMAKHNGRNQVRHETPR